MLRLPLLLPSADNVNYRAWEVCANEQLHKHRMPLLAGSGPRRGGGGSAVPAPAWAHVRAAAAPALPGRGLCPSPASTLGARGCGAPGAGIASLRGPVEICPRWADVAWGGCPVPRASTQPAEGHTSARGDRPLLTALLRCGTLGCSAAPEDPRCCAACRALPVPLGWAPQSHGAGAVAVSGRRWRAGRRRGTRTGTQPWCRPGNVLLVQAASLSIKLQETLSEMLGGDFCPRSQRGPSSLALGISAGTVLCSAVLRSWASSRPPEQRRSRRCCPRSLGFPADSLGMSAV